MNTFDYDALEENGLGQTEATAAQPENWWQKLIGAVGATAQQVAAYKASKQIAKSGAVPTAQLNVGMAPETQRMLLFGGLAVGAVLLLTMGRKRR